MNRDTKFSYWYEVAKCSDYQLGDYERPPKVGDVEVPADLNALTIGQLIELGNIKTDTAYYDACRIVLNLDTAQVDEARAVEVVAFLSWLTREVKRINDLFNALQPKYTATEIKAGIEKLKSGMFGLLDWYAKRMGITNHDDVLPVPWLRIYKCMEIDYNNAEFQKRYMEVQKNDIHSKSYRRGTR